MLERRFIIIFIFIFIGIATAGRVPPKTPVVKGFGAVAVGSRLELHCDGSQPDALSITYSWFKHSKDWETRGPIASGRILVFDPVSDTRVFYEDSPAEHVAGFYMCRARNAAGTRDSKWSDGELYVYKPCTWGTIYSTAVMPPVSPINSTLTLHCHIGKPSGRDVKWTKQYDVGTSITDEAVVTSTYCQAPVTHRFYWYYCQHTGVDRTDFNLRTPKADPDDTAWFVCRDTGLNCSSSPVRPIVQVPPGKTEIVGFPLKPVVEGTIVSLKCVSAHPSDSIDWYRSTNKISTSSTYDFIAKRSESASNYHCVAINSAGSVASSIKRLEVFYKAAEVNVSAKGSVDAGETDEFRCSASGGSPTPKLTLYFNTTNTKDPEEVTQGQKKVMRKEDNQAEYYCKATVPGYPKLTVISEVRTYDVKFANTKVLFTTNSPLPVQDGSVKIIQCRTDGSNPQVRSLEMVRLKNSIWEKITTAIKTSQRAGPHGSTVVQVEWSLTATREMNGQLVKCESRYTNDGYKFQAMATMFISTAFPPENLTIIKKPLKPIRENQSAVVTCEAGVANPAPRIQFSKRRVGESNEKLNDTFVSSEDRNVTQYNGKIRKSTLNIVVNRLDHKATIECEVQTGTTAVKQATEIEVHYPPEAYLTLAKTPVKEGDDLELICSTTGGNPQQFTYEWYYNNEKVQHQTSREYKITTVLASQSGRYSCKAINYQPGGETMATKLVAVQFKPRLNPLYPASLYSASKLGRSCAVVFHLEAHPAITNITSYHPNGKLADQIGFTVARTNSGNYSSVLSIRKDSVQLSDYGKYPVTVANVVGVLRLAFELQQNGPPYTPRDLKEVNKTAVSIVLSMVSNFNGGPNQTFTLEMKQESTWSVIMIDITDPGFGKTLTLTISDLNGDKIYSFRAMAVNEEGRSAFGNVLSVRTKAAPNTTFSIEFENGSVMAKWTPLQELYTKMQIKYCQRDRPVDHPTCKLHNVADQSTGEATFQVEETNKTYTFYLLVFDANDLVFESDPVLVDGERESSASVTTTESPLHQKPFFWAMIAGVLVAVLVIIIAIPVIVILYRRRRGLGNDENPEGRNPESDSDTDDSTSSDGSSPSSMHTSRQGSTRRLILSKITCCVFD